MAIESIDNMLEQLVLSGAVKVDMDQPDPSGKPGRCCPIQFPLRMWRIIFVPSA